MSNIAIAVHGGAGPDSPFIQQNIAEYKEGIRAAINAGYHFLRHGGSAVEAVEAAVKALEDNPLFNAGKGAALNEVAAIEMCASIMNGNSLDSGATAIVRSVKNPIQLARIIMEQSEHIYLGDSGAEKFAKDRGIELVAEQYFKTPHTFQDYVEKKKELSIEDGHSNNKMHGTVGAVALDQFGNVAAATSTGGTELNSQGRIGDSSMIGAGTYANNETCAVSATGDGEYNIRFVSAFHVAALIEYKGMSLEEACYFLIHEKARNIKGDMGLIAINKDAVIAMAFNAQRMHRGWKKNNDAIYIGTYAND